MKAVGCSRQSGGGRSASLIPQLMSNADCFIIIVCFYFGNNFDFERSVLWRAEKRLHRHPTFKNRSSGSISRAPQTYI